MAKTRIGAMALAGYIAAIVAANITTAHYGLVSVGAGLTVTAGTFWIGIALLARNIVQDAFGRRAVIAAIATGALLSAFTSPSLALASGIAFGASELADTTVYTPLRAKGWARAALTASLVGALADTLLFLTLAGFPLTTRSIAGQFLVKTAVAWASITLISPFRSVRCDQMARNTLDA